MFDEPTMFERFLCAKAFFGVYCEDSPEEVNTFVGQIYLFDIHFAKVIEDDHIIRLARDECWLSSDKLIANKS